MPHPEKILHVFPSFGSGGVPQRIASIMNALGPRYRHVVVALDGNLDARERVDPGIPVEFEGPPPLKAGVLGSILAYRREIRRHDPACMFTYNWGSIEWSLANRLFSLVPEVHSENGFGKEEAHRQIPRRVLTRRFGLGHVKAFLVPSRTLAEIATKRWHIRPELIRFIPNGVDLKRYSAAPDPDIIANLGPEVRVIGTLAPIRPEKNIKRLVRAFHRVSATTDSLRLVVVGEGLERAPVEELVRDLGLTDRVLLTGHLPRPEKILGRFDVFAMSSDTEQRPNALLQAMAAGLPVVAPDVGDIAEMVSEMNRPYLARANDDAELAMALEKLTRDPDLARSLGRANREHVATHFQFDGMAGSYRELIEGVLA